ncbi:MAG: Crp/Fnr family transcriptional regulator [Lewinellaceae bacterium]|nr:Crp/Fnr family transcriptional regulator [Saprospiraceae bacterium]MCB9336735.1 Crp/Fnr family transcriptional regulator [Lewinellaceae bacterium]
MNQTQTLWYLENIDLTSILCPGKIKASGQSLEHKTYKKGAYIYLPGEYADKIFFIMEGRVKIGTYSDTGKEITKTIIGPGEVFGEMPLAGEEERRNYAIALEDTLTCVLSVAEMRNLLREHGPLTLFFMKIFGNRMLEMEKRLESLVFKDSRSRVVEFLKNLAIEKGQRVGYEWVVRKFFTHQEIASLTATSRQTVTTVLNDLESKNILTYNRRRLLIRDIEALGQEMNRMVERS